MKSRIQNLHQLKKWIPEMYLLVSVIYYWIMTGTLLNVFAILLLLVLIMLIVVKNKMLGLTISALFLVLNLFMVLALISELMEFGSFNQDAWLMLLVGSAYLGVNILISIVMLMKWAKETATATVRANAS